MRYQDWDVLLFPAGEGEGTHIPVKEFRTQCYVEQYEGQNAPLLTTFIPAMPRGVPFQVSIHSWTKTGPMLAPAADGTKAKEAWQVKVVIDGACVGMESYEIDASWPQIMQEDNQKHKLRFPPFHRTMLSQNSWNAADTMGRIRIELSSGYLEEKYGHFIKTASHVNFAFQPGPMDVLEHNGLAWPNPRIFANPIPSGGFLAPSNIISNVPAARHRRVASASHLNMQPVAMGGMVAPPVLNYYNQFAYGMNGSNGNYDPSSRSTSAYSVYTDSAAPLLKKDSLASAYPGTQQDGMQKTQNQPMNIRLPSDQLEMIIKAIQVPHQTQHIGEPNSIMPPPPLPQHAMASKDNNQLQQRIASFGLSFPPFGETNGTTTNGNRREVSRYSDISMHPSCTSFPVCTTEDAEGRIIHDPNCPQAANNIVNGNGAPGAPAEIVRGRKEGSSPTKPRDFFSTILDTTAAANPHQSEPGLMDTQSPARMNHSSMEMVRSVAPGLLTSSSPADTMGTRKRTRSALKSLNIKDGGSPEKKKDVAAPKPPRKASRASVSEIKDGQEIVLDGQENMMVDA